MGNLDYRKNMASLLSNILLYWEISRRRRSAAAATSSVVYSVIDPC